MSRKPILIAVMAALCAVLLVASGCGGKKKAAATTAAPATTAAQTESTSTPPATTAASTTTATTTTSGGGSADCQSFASAAQDVGQQFSQALSGTGTADMAKASAAFDSLTSKAPSAIRPDFQTIDDAFKKMAVALKGVDLSGGKTPDAATIAKLQQLGTQINQAKLTAAETHISAWVSQNCHA